MSVLGLIVAAVLASVVFATTLILVPAPAPVVANAEHPHALRFRGQVMHLSRELRQMLSATHNPVSADAQAKPITVGFFTSWSDESTPALRAHVAQLDWVAPTSLTLDPQGGMHAVSEAGLRHILAGTLHPPLVVPVIQNAIEGNFDGEHLATLMADPARRAALIQNISVYLDRTGDDGIMFDFENLPANSLPNLHRLVAETRAVLAPKHKIVSLTVPIDSADWKPGMFGDVADRVILMAYDQHWQGGTPGPIAANDWFASRVRAALQGLRPGQGIIALGNYAYDWHDQHADSLTVEEAWLSARDSSTTPQFDAASGNSGFAFDDNGHRHDVWMLDAASSWNQMRMLSGLGVQNVALWRLGSEDPGFWPTLAAWRNGTRPDLSRITQQNSVDVEGSGEILDVTERPTPGQRQVAYDAATGMITRENYGRLPTPYVVQRTGALPGKIALTFDDGPDPVWTPQILAVLERYHVPATFFIVGENGLTNQDLLRRMTADGDQIGNHSYTHPNMGQESDRGISLEINATTRLIEAATGHSTRLFRAPYFGDAEPTTADELGPAVVARRHGYRIVGLHVDSEDWTQPGVRAIVDNTVRGVQSATPDRSGNIVLLHDAGGNRAETLAALPTIITTLQNAGYQFVTVGTLAGMTPEQAMPTVSGSDLLAVRADIAIFGVLAAIVVALNWTFFFAISLGVVRAIGLTILSRLPKRPRQNPPALIAPKDGEAYPLVSVIIPAYNEEKVIAASIHRVLDSDYPAIEVIVADDGSADRTSAIVRDAFGSDPRVKLLTLVNGGKASALNRALLTATGSIVVALDADTQFERETISRLVRWFANPVIGAVAGNAKVGNRINLVTRWQGVEYVTAQNLERRALDRLGAIMVVPGAVGAWRRAALDDVGGYPEDTLAEDQDLTIAIQRKGWRVAYDEDAVAWTEAPETLRALAKQRFRWSFGTLQCLWKHRALLRKGRPSGLAFVGFPQAWLFQVIFAVISPAIDLALLVSIIGTVVRVFQHGWAQTQTDVLFMAAYWCIFTAVDVLCGWFAYRSDVRERRFPMFLLLAQRFVYRQLMYSVVIRAVSAATAGLGVGWGKLDRSGAVTAPAGAT